jgi:hypothetical protein
MKMIDDSKISYFFIKRKNEIIEPLNYLYSRELQSYKESINIIQLIILLQIQPENFFNEKYSVYDGDNFEEYSSKYFSYIIQTNNLRSYLDTFEKISPVLATLCFSNFIMKQYEENNLKMFKLYQVLLFLALRIKEYRKNNISNYNSTLRMLANDDKVIKSKVSDLIDF